MHPHSGNLVGADGSPTGVDGIMSVDSDTTEGKAPQAPLPVPATAVVRPAAVRPTAVRPAAVRPAAVRPAAVRPVAARPVAVRPSAVPPKAVPAAETTTADAPDVAAPKVVRPKAVRPDAHAAMLERLAQDFQNHPPPVAPMGEEEEDSDNIRAEKQIPIDVINVNVTQQPELQPAASLDNQWGLQVNPTVGDAKKRLRARRTLSNSNLASVREEDNPEDQQAVPPEHAPLASLQLQRPTPVRPKPVRPKPQKAADPQGGQMMNQIAHDFQNLPTQQISLSRAPSAPPPESSYSLHRAPSVAPHEQQQPQPQPVLMQPTPSMMNQSRPRLRRHNSGRSHKPSWYHRVAAKNKLGSIQEDPLLLREDQQEENTSNCNHEGQISPLGCSSSCYNHAPWDRIQAAKGELLQELNRAALSPDGNNNTPAFQAALQVLVQNYDPIIFDPRAPVLAYHPYQMQLEGIGISAGKPTFPGCIGNNPKGDPMYKLGTMSFDMFRPTELVVSVQGTFCLIDGVDRNNLQEVKNVPKNLQNDVRHGINPVRTYNIVTPFTIEAWRPEFGEDSPNKGVSECINGVMTTYGFLLPYPTQNRFSVWFTGGSLEVDETKNEKWFQIFDKSAAPKRTALQASKLLAAKLIMGACVNDEMDKDGTLKYTLTRPVASYIDLIYLDNSLQVLRGSSGTVYVHVRLPGGSGAVHQSTYSDQLLPSPVDPYTSTPSPVNRF